MLSSLLSPFRFLFSREKAELVLDDTQFKVCEGKVVSLWSWKKMKNEKWLVHLNETGKFNIRKLK
jgi:hypothetical protein